MPESLQRGALGLQGVVEAFLGQLALLDQDVAESILQTFGGRVRQTVSFSLLRVSRPVFRCRPMSWKMSGSPKSRIVPSSAIAASP
jgi:hypothetical protein